MNLLKSIVLRNAQLKMNTPTTDCPDCQNCKDSLLFLANNLNDKIDITKIIMICATCTKSLWFITTRKVENEGEPK